MCETGYGRGGGVKMFQKLITLYVNDPLQSVYLFFVQGAGLTHRYGSSERLGRVLGCGTHSTR